MQGGGELKVTYLFLAARCKCWMKHSLDSLSAPCLLIFFFIFLLSQESILFPLLLFFLFIFSLFSPLCVFFFFFLRILLCLLQAPCCLSPQDHDKAPGHCVSVGLGHQQSRPCWTPYYKHEGMINSSLSPRGCNLHADKICNLSSRWIGMPVFHNFLSFFTSGLSTSEEEEEEQCMFETVLFCTGNDHFSIWPLRFSNFAFKPLIF